MIVVKEFTSPKGAEEGKVYAMVGYSTAGGCTKVPTMPEAVVATPEYEGERADYG